MSDRPAADSTTVGPEKGRAFFTPAFIVALVVLGAAALGLNYTVASLKLHFQKLPVSLSHPLKDIRPRFGHWVQVSRDQPLESDIEHALGTKEYVFRDYVNESIVGAATIASFRDLSDRERYERLAEIRRDRPDAVVNMAVTYYTGLVDTVPHVPDRCYIADGYEPRERHEENWSVADHPVRVSYINFEDQTGFGKQPRSVAYFFNSNGDWLAGPVDVRLRLQNLSERYGYFAKIELMTILPDRDKSREVMQDFLRQALPEVRKVLPRWPVVEPQQGTDAKQVAQARPAGRN